MVHMESLLVAAEVSLFLAIKGQDEDKVGVGFFSGGQASVRVSKERVVKKEMFKKFNNSTRKKRGEEKKATVWAKKRK